MRTRVNISMAFESSSYENLCYLKAVVEVMGDVTYVFIALAVVHQ